MHREQTAVQMQLTAVCDKLALSWTVKLQKEDGGGTNQDGKQQVIGQMK